MTLYDATSVATEPKPVGRTVQTGSLGKSIQATIRGTVHISVKDPMGSGIIA